MTTATVEETTSEEGLIQKQAELKAQIADLESRYALVDPLPDDVAAEFAALEADLAAIEEQLKGVEAERQREATEREAERRREDERQRKGQERSKKRLPERVQTFIQARNALASKLSDSRKAILEMADGYFNLKRAAVEAQINLDEDAKAVSPHYSVGDPNYPIAVQTLIDHVHARSARPATEQFSKLEIEMLRAFFNDLQIGVLRRPIDQAPGTREIEGRWGFEER